MSSQPEEASRSGEVEPRISHAGWSRLGAFLLLVVLALTLVIVVSRRMVRPPPIPFDQRSLNLIKRARPEFVLLGNSMVATRFDENLLGRLLHRRISVLGLLGTASSGWYLAIKNLVIASGSRPRVILFFRELELTEPRMWTEGHKGGRRMRQLSQPDDESLLDRKLAPPLKDPMARFEWYRNRSMPIELLRQETDGLVDTAGELGSRLAWRTTTDARARMRAINELFALSNLRATDAVAEPPTVLGQSQVFEEVVEQSFLPDMFELAAANGIPLTFVRVRTRAAASGEAKTATEQRYDSNLERYLRSRGAEFYDMHDATWETLDMYAMGDHIGGRFTRRYTALFAEHMAQIFH